MCDIAIPLFLCECIVNVICECYCCMYCVRASGSAFVNVHIIAKHYDLWINRTTIMRHSKFNDKFIQIFSRHNWIELESVALNNNKFVCLISMRIKVKICVVHIDCGHASGPLVYYTNVLSHKQKQKKKRTKQTINV